MPPKFGVITPQGWRLDRVNIKDPIEKYEQMTRFAQEAERLDYDFCMGLRPLPYRANPATGNHVRVLDSDSRPHSRHEEDTYRADGDL